MAGAHVIETLSFEVDFASEAEAHAQHMRFGDFAAGRGVAVIAEVFDEFVGPEETLRLDRLEVDLGEPLAAWSEAEAEQRLREALRRALREAIGSRRHDGPTPEQEAADAGAELEMVWGHLHHGLLPWSADPASPALFDALVARVLAARGAALAARLREAPARARLVVRLARQWPAAALAELARWLAPEAGAPSAVPPGAPLNAAAWEALLMALTQGRDAAGPDTTGARGARSTAPPVVDEAAWPGLINGEPAAVRARLRAAGREDAARVQLAALLTEARQRQVLGLWASPADAEFVLALLAATQAWRLGASLSDMALHQALRRGLLDHLLAEGREQLEVAACVESLVAARARADGLAPDRIAWALVAAWPANGPAGALRARLLAALAARLVPRTPGADGQTDIVRADLGSVSAPSPDAPGSPPTAAPAWRFEVGDEADPATARDAPWRNQFRLEPSGLAAHLRRLGRSAAWRRRLARDLTSARLGEILALWTEPADAAFLAAMVETPEPWRIGTDHAATVLALRLREWLLDDLLLGPADGPPRAGGDLALGLVRCRAAYDDLSVAAVARVLARAWPAEGSAGGHRAQLLEILSGVANGEVVAEPAVPGEQALATAAVAPAASASEDEVRTLGITVARRELEAVLARRAFRAEASRLRTALATDRAWLLDALRRHGADAATRRALVEALPAGMLFELAQPWLSEAHARLVLVLAPTPARGAVSLQAFWAEVLAAVWGEPSGAAVVEAAREGATNDAVALADDSVALRAGPAALLRRLLRTADLAEGTARARAVRAARGYLRDEVVTTLRLPAPEALPSLAAWRGRLPIRPSAAVMRALAAALTPAAAGLRQLAEFPDAERRALVLRLRPADAAHALGALEVLTEAARSVSLLEPQETWAEFNWRVLLSELFEEGRGFDLPGFTARWFEAWVAVVPVGSEGPGRRRLALVLEAARVTGTTPGAATSNPSASRSDQGSRVPATGASPAAAPGVDARPTLTGDIISPAPRVEASRQTPVAPSLSEPSSLSEPGAPARPALQQAAEAPDADPASVLPPPADMRVRGDVGEVDQGATSDTPAAEISAPGPQPDFVTGKTARGASPDGSLDPAAPSIMRPDPAALAAALRPAAPQPATAAPDADPARDDTLYVANAGLVLAGPYIPMLLSRLELTRDGRFVDDRAQERAVHLLQFLVDGEAEPAAEHRLVLNKLVCGLDFPVPVGRDFQVRDPERAMIESLLRTMVARWSALGRTSLAGLRETFLRRQGALAQDDGAWRLAVEPRAFDMLLDRIPWGYGTLKLPWMAQVLHVDWR